MVYLDDKAFLKGGENKLIMHTLESCTGRPISLRKIYYLQRGAEEKQT